jgi:hypothetical protein
VPSVVDFVSSFHSTIFGTPEHVFGTFLRSCVDVSILMYIKRQTVSIAQSIYTTDGIPAERLKFYSL